MGEHRPADAEIHAAAARVISQERCFDDLRCESLELLGRAARVRDVEQAQRFFLEELAVAETAGLRFWSGRALHELGTIDVGRMADTTHLAAASALASDIGAPGLGAVIDYHLAVLHYFRYELDAATQVIARAAQAATRHRLGLLVPALILLNGSILAVQGHRQRAIARFQEAMPHDPAHYQQTGNTSSTTTATSNKPTQAGPLPSLHRPASCAYTSSSDSQLEVAMKRVVASLEINGEAGPPQGDPPWVYPKGQSDKVAILASEGEAQDLIKALENGVSYETDVTFKTETSFDELGVMNVGKLQGELCEFMPVAIEAADGEPRVWR